MTALLAFLSLQIFTPDLSKEEVQRLVAAGVSDDVIVTFIRTYGPVRPLSTTDLIELRDAGVSEKVLTAMVASTTSTPPAEVVPQEPPVTYSYPWYYPSGYYYDYYSGPYAWWWIGPGRTVYPYYRYGYTRYGYTHGYPYYPYSLHGYRGGVYPPYHHPVNPPQRPPHVQPPPTPRTQPPRTQPPHNPPPRPPPAPHSIPRGGRH